MPSYKLPEGVERFTPGGRDLGFTGIPAEDGEFIRISDLPAILAQERQRVREALTERVRSFRREADQHEAEAIESGDDRTEQARLNSGAAVWRAAATSLERELAALDSLEDGDGEQLTERDPDEIEADRRHIDQLRKTAAGQKKSADGFEQLAGEENARLADRLEAEWFPDSNTREEAGG